MTQPAVSHALRRLRRITNDELFIKVPGRVQLRKPGTLGADSRRLIANSSGALACLRSSHRQASFHHCNDRLFCFASITASCLPIFTVAGAKVPNRDRSFASEERGRPLPEETNALK